MTNVEVLNEVNVIANSNFTKIKKVNPNQEFKVLELKSSDKVNVYQTLIQNKVKVGEYLALDVKGDKLYRIS